MGINVQAAERRAISVADSKASKSSARRHSDSRQTISDSSVTAPENKWFSKLCERLWLDKPAAALDHLTSAKLHQCYRYASGRQEPAGSLIVELLRGPDGERVLDDIMRGSKQKWDIERRVARIRSAGITETEQRVQHELALG